jgi:hypothetical protein
VVIPSDQFDGIDVVVLVTLGDEGINDLSRTSTNGILPQPLPDDVWVQRGGQSLKVASPQGVEFRSRSTCNVPG